MQANIGDTVILENGLRLEIVANGKNKFDTYDIDKEKECTTEYSISELQDFIVGKLVYGYGLDELEIVEIIKNQSEPYTFQNYSDEELINELNKRLKAYKL